jgi:hypothetical protein
MAGAAYAVVAGMEALIPSAAGGWGQIPQDTMAMVHKDEMILPANIAQGVRNMATAGGGGGGSPATTNMTFNVRAIDGQSVMNMLRNQQSTIVSILSNAARNNNKPAMA